MKTLQCLLMAAFLLAGLPPRAGMAAEKEPFVIGVILPLTGNYKSLGSGVKEGIEFAYHDLSAGDKAKVRLIFEDDALQAPRSVAAFQKLRKLEKAQAFIVVSSGIGHALAPLAEREEVPLIAVGASDFKITQGRVFSFLHWVIPEVEAASMAKEAKRRGYERLAIITAQQQGWMALYDAFIKQLEVQGMRDKLVFDEQQLPDETNYQSSVAKIQSKGAQAVFMLMMPEPLVAFVKQLRGGGSKADIVGPEMFEDQAVLDALGDLLYDQWYVNADSAIPEFTVKYKQKTGRLPGFGVANAYDSLNLLFEAGAGKELRGRKIAEALRVLKDYHGAAGIYSATGDNRFTLPAAVKKVIKGGAEKIE